MDVKNGEVGQPVNLFAGKDELKHLLVLVLRKR